MAASQRVVPRLRLVELMDKRKMSVNELVMRAGIARQNYYLLARGADVRMSTLVAVAKALNVRLDELVEVA